MYMENHPLPALFQRSGSRQSSKAGHAFDRLQYRGRLCQSDKDFARFLVIAKGSCGEVRAQLLIAMAQEYITKEQYSDLSGAARQISAGLANLARYLRLKSQR
jgi:four helix bundle protein